MKIITWNVNSVRARIDHVKLLLEKQKPDILCLQEIKADNDVFPDEIFHDYDTAVHGQKAYNGVSIHTAKKGKKRLEDVEVISFLGSQSRIIAGSFAGLRIINVYVPAGAPSVEKFEQKMQFMLELKAFVERTQSIFKNVIVLGDFNIAPTNQDVYNNPHPYQICCTDVERACYSELLKLGLADTWRYSDNVNRFSWYDYRHNSFENNMGLRIDHILVSDHLKKGVKKYKTLAGYRKLEKPSDHLPVVMELRKT